MYELVWNIIFEQSRDREIQTFSFLHQPWWGLAKSLNKPIVSRIQIFEKLALFKFNNRNTTKRCKI